MITSKFTIGQQVRHKLLGCLGVIVDVDPNYSLSKSKLEDANLNDSLLNSPWYHVVIEDDDGQTVHTYLAEAQLDHEMYGSHEDHPSLDELAESIRYQFKAPNLRH